MVGVCEGGTGGEAGPMGGVRRVPVGLSPTLPDASVIKSLYPPLWRDVHRGYPQV